MNFEVDIPESIDGSFYHGRVDIGLKNSAFQPSSPIRHACELRNILKTRAVQPILLLYTDGGRPQTNIHLNAAIPFVAAP